MEIRRTGYALNVQESIEVIHALCAPIFDDNDGLIGAEGAAGAAQRPPIGICHAEIRGAVLAAVNEIELHLKYAQLNRAFAPSEQVG